MATNIEVAARSLKLAQREGYNEFKTMIKSINTGRYIYTVYGIYTVERGIIISVTKYRPNNQLIGHVIIDRFSNQGLEYDNSLIGSLPDSVSKAIREFAIVYNRITI